MGGAEGLAGLQKLDFIFTHAKFQMPISYPKGDDKKAGRHTDSNSVGMEIKA